MKANLFGPAHAVLQQTIDTYRHNAAVAFKEGRLKDGIEHSTVVYGLTAAAGFLETGEVVDLKVHPCRITGCNNIVATPESACPQCVNLLAEPRHLTGVL